MNQWIKRIVAINTSCGTLVAITGGSPAKHDEHPTGERREPQPSRIRSVLAQVLLDDRRDRRLQALRPDYECNDCSSTRRCETRDASPPGPDSLGALGGRRHRVASLPPPPRLGAVRTGGRVRTGLDEFGRRLPGRIYCVALPEPGTRIAAGEPAWTFVHCDGEVSVAAPVSGIVAESNERLRHQPSLVNQDPYGAGWAVVLCPRPRRRPAGSVFGAEIAPWIAEESEKLSRELTSAGDSLPTIMDGGCFVDDLHQAIPAEARSRILDLFLSANKSRPSDPPTTVRPATQKGDDRHGRHSRRSLHPSHAGDRRAGSSQRGGARGSAGPTADRATRGLFLDSGHTWTALEPSGRIRVGLDDLVRGAVGRIDKLELPEPGTEVKRGQPLFALVQGGRRAALPSPVDGVVRSVNPLVAETAGPVAADPYYKGWVCALRRRTWAPPCAA